MGCIYCAKNIVNNKCYIGQTIHTMIIRRKDHEKDSLNGSKICFHLALAKHGFNNFEWFTIYDDLEDDELDLYERAAIRNLNTLSPSGYNLMDGGSPGKHSEETKQKISEIVKKEWAIPGVRERRSVALKGKTYEEIHGEEKAVEIRLNHSKIMTGKKQTQESNVKRSKALKGKAKSFEAKNNISNSAKNRSPEAQERSIAGLMEYNERRAEEGISEETRKKQSESHRGKKLSEETKNNMKIAQQKRRSKKATRVLA